MYAVITACNTFGIALMRVDMSARIAVILIVFVTLTGCRSDSAKSEVSSKAVATPVESEAADDPATTEADSSQPTSGIAPDDLLRVCCRFEGEEILPFYECASEGCRPGGFEPELVEALAEKLNVEWKWVELDGNVEDPRLTLLEVGDADISVMLITVTEERAERVRFTDTYLDTGLGVLVRSDDEIQGPDDMAGRKVFVVPGTTPARWLSTEQPKALAVQELTRPYRGPVTLVDMLLDGEIDAYINDWRHISYVSERYDGVTILDDVLVEEELAIAVSPHAEHWKTRLNTALRVLEDGGDLPELRERWFEQELLGAQEGE